MATRIIWIALGQNPYPVTIGGRFSVSLSVILILSNAQDVHVIMWKSLMETVKEVKALENSARAMFACCLQEGT